MRTNIFAIQFVPHYDVHLVALDAQEVDILTSAVELLDEHAGLTFNDWMEANPDHAKRVEKLLERLREWESTA